MSTTSCTSSIARSTTKATRRTTSFRASRWRITGALDTTTRCARCGIKRCLSARAPWKACPPSTSRNLAANEGVRPRPSEQESPMKEADVLAKAFAMPLTGPAFPCGPYRFNNREYLIITYRTDPERLRAVVPEPLEVTEPLVKYEFIRMPDSTGFGDHTETGQVIPVSFRGKKGGYSHCMFLNDEPPIAGGRELWGFPKKLASPSLRTEIDMLVGTLDYGPVRVATGTMAYKHKQADQAAIKATLSAPNFLLKIIPHVDGSARIC